MTEKQPIDLPFAPGVNTEQTPRGSAPQWKDSDKVRFRNGLPEKIGGWRGITTEDSSGDELQVKGIARKFLDWASLDGQHWVAIGTDAKLYLWQNDILYDITPLRAQGTLTDPFSTTDGSSLVIVEHANHGVQQGDYVRFTGPIAVDGVAIDGEYQVYDIIDIDHYRIDVAQTADADTTDDGGDVAYEYDISVGRSSTGYGIGYGLGPYGSSSGGATGGYGTARTGTATARFPVRTWSLENWGEDLIANPRGGAIYWWDKTTGPSTRAVVLSGAPARCNYIVMNDRSRQLIAFGCTDEITGVFDPLLERWCSIEDFHDWVQTEANTAASDRVYQGSMFITAARTRVEILAFTDRSVHSVQQVGSGEFTTTLVGPNVAIMGPNAWVNVANRVYFMAEGDFYVYDGIPRPLPCSVNNHVYDNLIDFQKDKFHAGLNTLFGEVWFFYAGKAPDIWLDVDFGAGINDTIFGPQEQGLDEILTGQDYSFTFSPRGYIWLTEGLENSSYSAIWLLREDNEVLTPTEAEYEITFTIASEDSIEIGLAFCVDDLVADPLEDPDGDEPWLDDVDGLFVTIDPSNNRLYFKKRFGTFEMIQSLTRFLVDHPLGYVDLSTLATPIDFTVGSRYGIIVKRYTEEVDGEITHNVAAYIWDEDTDTTQFVETVWLSDSEVERSANGAKAGLIGQLADTSASVADPNLFHSFRVGAIDSILTHTQRGASREINRYAVYNYLTDVWAIGALARTAWADTSRVFNHPYAAAPIERDSVLYTHDDGVDADGEAMPNFIESHDAEIPDAGEFIMQIDKMIPDFLRLRGSVDITLKGKKYPANEAYTTDGPHTITPSTGKVSVRIRGRQVAVRIESSDIGDYWRYGTLRARVFPHGKRGNA